MSAVGNKHVQLCSYLSPIKHVVVFCGEFGKIETIELSMHKSDS